MHGKMSKVNKFNVPIHPRNLAQLIHPYQGYLSNMQGTLFSFEDLVQVYQNQIVSSYEKTFGNTLLGDELSCLSFWLLHDEDRKGWLTLQDSKPLLSSLKFPDETTDSLACFRTEFKF